MNGSLEEKKKLLQQALNQRDVLKSQIDNLPQVKNVPGVNVLMRAALSTASSQKGRENILRNFGFTPVQTRSGQLGVLGKDNKVRPVDPDRFDVGDIADFAGDLLPAVGSTGGGVLGLSGGAVTGPGALATGMAGAAAGGTAGELARQGVGAALGADEGLNVSNLAMEAATAPLGEAAGGVLSFLGKRVLAPVKANRELVQQAAEADKALGTNISEVMPLTARTRSDLVAGIEQGVAESLPTKSAYREQVSEPLDREMKKGLAAIQAKPTGMRPEDFDKRSVDVGDELIAAATKTMKAREKQVNALYDKVGEVLPANMPVSAKNALAAIYDIAETTGAEAHRDVRLPSEIIRQIDDLEEAAVKTTTWRQLDGLRRLVGTMTSGGAEQFKATGLAAKMDQVYAGLAEDARIVARQAGEDAPQRLERAQKSFNAILELDKKRAARMLKSEETAESVVSSIAKPHNVAIVKNLKNKIGAVVSDEGLVATGEGKQAWESVQNALMKQLGEKSIHEDLFSGRRLESAIQAAGGKDVLTEFFGEEVTDQLIRFSKMARESNPQDLVNWSRTGRVNEMLGYAGALSQGTQGIIGKIAQGAGTKALGEAVMSPGGRKWITEGYAQSPRGQTILNVLGRTAAQAPRAAIRGRVTEDLRGGGR